jgi:polyisoprenoid-binding protein YceI
MRRLLACGLVVVASLAAHSAAQGLELVSGEVLYHAQDQRERFTGRAPIARLELTRDPQQLARLQLVVAIETGRFDSGNLIRDANARRLLFDSRNHPEATFNSSVERVLLQLADSETITADLRGELTVRKLTRPLAVPVTLTREGDTLTAEGGFSLRLSDYGLPRPTFLWLQVEDEVEVGFRVVMRLLAASP